MNLLDFYYGSEVAELSVGYDAERAKRKAIAKILPLIFDNELTAQQVLCLKYKYLYGKSQKEIAALTKLSQPTVSRYITRATAIVNDKLKYSWAAVTCALEEYEK